MAQIQPILKIELDPTKPVPEVCSVISSLVPYHANNEEALLKGIKEAIDKRLSHLEKGGVSNEQVRKPSTAK